MGQSGTLWRLHHQLTCWCGRQTDGGIHSCRQKLVGKETVSQRNLVQLGGGHEGLEVTLALVAVLKIEDRSPNC